MIGRFLHWLGYGLCHQLPERSFSSEGIQAPVCARDTGIYLGFVISFAIIALLHRGERRREFPRGVAWIVLAAFVAFMGWDGVTSYAGLRESNNALRLVTGLCAGFAIAAIVVPMLNDVLWADTSPGHILDPRWRLGTWVSVLPVSALALWWGGPLLGIAYPLMIGAAIIVTLTSVSLVIVGMAPMFDRKALGLGQVIAPALGALLLTVVEVWMSGLFRSWLVGVVRATVR